METFVLYTTVGSLCLASALGCAHAPPAELHDARAAYKQAESGIASQETPAQLHTANNALLEAEQSFDSEGDTEHTRDLAYVAMRKAQVAEVQARVAQSKNRLAAGTAEMKQAQSQELTELRGQYATQQQQLSASETARKDADARAKQASADLARIASVKEDARGTVITLSGEVLFREWKGRSPPQRAGQAE